LGSCNSLNINNYIKSCQEYSLNAFFGVNTYGIWYNPDKDRIFTFSEVYSQPGKQVMDPRP